MQGELAIGFGEVPLQLWESLVVGDLVMQSIQAAEDPRIVFESMNVVGAVENVLLSRQVVVIKIESVERPIRVVGSQDDQLGLREGRAVAVGVDNFQQVLSLRGVHDFVEALLLVVADFFTQVAERELLQVHLLIHPQRVDDHRGQRGCPFIGGSG